MRPFDQRVTTVVAAGGVFVCSFLFRFLYPQVNNDFFLHVVRGRQMLLGELPVRDFVETGLPAMSVVSALAEAVGGHNLMAEFTASTIFMSIGAVLVFLLASEASRSQVIGLLIAMWTVLMEPRLYSYPKIFLYPLALWLMWRYLDRPGRVRMVVLAGCTALAFLFRHDHGVYIGLAVALTLFMRHWQGGRRDLLRAMTLYALVTALLLSPYLLFIQVHGGLGAYVRTGVEFSRDEAVRNGRVWPTWRREAVRLFEESAPPQPKVHVRWTANVASDHASRAAAERRHGLMHADFQARMLRTWAYDLQDPSREKGLSMLDDPDIEDVTGIDRSTGDLVAPLAEPPSRFVFFEDVGTLISSNALPWLFHLFWTMPLAAIGVLVCRRARGTLSSAVMPYETEKILVLALLALLVNVGMLRDPLVERIGDVAAIAPIVGAWLMGLAFGGLGSIPRRLHGWWVAGVRPVSWRPLARAGSWAVRGVVFAAMFVATCVSVWEIGRLQIWLDSTGFGQAVSLARIRTLTIETRRYLSISPPVDAWAPPDSVGLKALTRYIHECTDPEDRLFIAGFFPDVHFYSGRGFAGGQEDFNPDLHSSLRDQRLTIDRLERQSVPIVLIKRDLAKAPIIDTYLRQRYRLVPHIDPETTEGLRLFVERRRAPTRVYTPLNTPCYA